MNPFDLSGKVICITGASSGIGRQCAISCSQFGATVVLLARNEERLAETLSLMEHSQKHIAFSVDLTDYEKVSQVVKDAVAKVGRMNGILHSAGISTTLPLKLVTPDKLEVFFQSNVFSAYNLTREICKMGNFSKDGGSIVFFSSVMGKTGASGKSLYSMTKGALLAGARSLACELAPKKIRVNTVSPGVVITPINCNLPHISDPERRKITEQQHLLGLGETTDIANACIYLLSDAAKWVTGIDLCVDGGYTAR